jgi:hypothetical protein
MPWCTVYACVLCGLTCVWGGWLVVSSLCCPTSVVQVELPGDRHVGWRDLAGAIETSKEANGCYGGLVARKVQPWSNRNRVDGSVER